MCKKINENILQLAEKTRPHVIPFVVCVWFIWLIPLAIYSYHMPLGSFLSTWASIASALSFAVLLPSLFLQLSAERRALEREQATLNRINEATGTHLKKQLTDIDQAIKDHLKELRRVPSTDESLKNFLNWMNPDSDKTCALLYVSKLSAIPGFWIRGSDTVANSLSAGDYSNGSKRKVYFIGPEPSTKTFQQIAQLAIDIANDGDRYEKLPEKTRTRFQFIRNMTILDIQNEYRRNLVVLKDKGIIVHELEDGFLEKLNVNFALRRIHPEYSAVNSPWEMMFFDDADILNGKSTQSQAEQAFFDPAIYMSENAALGYMFRFITLQATQSNIEV